MDTKYFHSALREFMEANRRAAIELGGSIDDLPVGELTLKQLSWCLARAQDIKDADQAARAEEQGKTCPRCHHTHAAFGNNCGADIGMPGRVCECDL